MRQSGGSVVSGLSMMSLLCSSLSTAKGAVHISNCMTVTTDIHTYVTATTRSCTNERTSMGKVIIQSEYTTRNPITMIGTEAGICWGADTSDTQKNYKRGLDCLESEHGRTFEFPDIYMILDGYSARVIRWRACVNSTNSAYQERTLPSVCRSV